MILSKMIGNWVESCGLDLFCSTQGAVADSCQHGNKITAQLDKKSQIINLFLKDSNISLILNHIQ